MVTKRGTSKSFEDKVPTPQNCDPEDVLYLLRQVIVSSLAGEKHAVALKALELWGRELGLFNQKKNLPTRKKLSDFSTQELQNLLEDEK